MHGFGDGDTEDLIVLVADHVAEAACGDELASGDAEARAEDAVERGRCAAALEMAEDAGARFLARPPRDFGSDDFADAAELYLAAAGGAHLERAVFCPRTFGDDDESAFAI